MKKILAGTTALIAVGTLAGAAQAADPIKLSVGGMMNQWLTIGDVDSYTYATGRVREYGNVGIISDTEIHFKGDTTLDNGLKVAVVIELEAERTDGSTARNADQQYVTLSGGWGQVRVGEMLNAATVVHNQAPGAGAANSDVASIFPASVPNGAGLQTLSSSVTTVDGIADAGAASVAIDYISPMFGPFAFGITYTPRVLSRGFAQENNSLNDLLGAAFVYADKWGPVSVNADIAYARFDYDNNISATGVLNSNATGVTHGLPIGVKFGYAGFEVGGSYFRIFDSLKAGASAGAQDGNAASGSFDGVAYDVGLAYTTGPWKFGYTFYKSSMEGDLRTKGRDKHQIHNGGGAYTMGPGVTVSANIAYQKYQDEVKQAGDKQEALGLITGLSLAF